MQAPPSLAARRYAAAFFAAAAEQGAVERCASDMRLLLRALSESSDFTALTMSPRLGAAEQQRILRAVFAGRVHAETLRFLGFLAQRRRLALLPQICRAFLDADDRAAGRVRGTLELARSTDAALAGAIAERGWGPERARPELAQLLKPELIGGFRLRIGDRLYDASIAGWLSAASRRLAGSAKEKAI